MTVEPNESSVYKTDRLVLRQWTNADREPFARLNQCKEVMRFFPRVFSSDESDSFINDNQSMIDAQGWGAWAVEARDTRQFIGFVGFSRPPLWHPCGGEIEIGWRLAHEFWNKGYATEAARRVLDIGFTILEFNEVVSYTSSINKPSISVMRKIGMSRDAHGFEHPRIDPDDRLCSHVVYRMAAPDSYKP